MAKRKVFRKILTKLSKVKLIRTLIPPMRTVYDAYVVGNRTSQILLEQAQVGRRRALYFWRWAPRKYWGGGLLSLIGLPLIRYYFHNLKYLLRFIKKDFSYPELRKQGVQICPNFVSSKFVDRILDFYKTHPQDVGHHFEDFSELTICNTKKSKKKGQDYDDIIKDIMNEAKIIELGESLTGKKIKINPFISILHYKSRPESKIQQDGQNIPHVDVFFPSYKLFIYLNEVTKDNGAFNYYAGSQKFCFKHAINYYKDSFRHYFSGGKKEIYPTDATIGLEGNYNWIAACGHPGDAVLFNVQGIHRRGEFKKDMFRERLVLLVDFRQVEVPIQMFAANA